MGVKNKFKKYYFNIFPKKKNILATITIVYQPKNKQANKNRK